ncbi:CPBP family intramembrane glutamic endopeptidase [Myxococcus sp. Y35]|uniref:CPBP family intramembrane glutamic endopeptidase n=1 Tax=Pseudomyxococcus flavus TaxID=3115648 RepID=UPI003CF7635B
MNTFALLSAYSLRLLPGLMLGAVLLSLLPRSRVELRLAIWLMLFVLLRDVMTPLGLWRFGVEGGFWLRMSSDAGFLLVMGVASAGVVWGMNTADPDLARAVVWRRGGWGTALALGTLGAGVVVLPVWLLSGGSHAGEAGAVSASLWPVLAMFCLLGNFYEEVLFRGYVQGLMEPSVGIWRAAVLSGVLFAFCHGFLALTVTDAGLPLLLFTLWEGCLAGLVRARSGVLAATLLHGGAIFLLASGLV